MHAEKHIVNVFYIFLVNVGNKEGPCTREHVEELGMEIRGRFDGKWGILQAIWRSETQVFSRVGLCCPETRIFCCFAVAVFRPSNMLPKPALLIKWKSITTNYCIYFELYIYEFIPNHS